jgi:hypothetical protein
MNAWIFGAWMISASAGFSTPSDPLPGDAFVAASLQAPLHRALSLEATLGPGLPTTTAARNASGGVREVDIASGLHASLLLRLEHRLTASGRWRVSGAAGPSLVSGDAFGTVPLAHADAALSAGLSSGLRLTFALGYESALTTSRTPFAASECPQASAACPPLYRAGHGQIVSRWSLGWEF